MGNAASHKALIWKVFGLLSVITAAEVGLGVARPDILVSTDFLGGFMPKVIASSNLNWIFVVLTLVKAYYIMWYFMHLADEKMGLRNAIVLPLLVFIPYLVVVLLIESNYTADALSKYIIWTY